MVGWGGTFWHFVGGGAFPSGVCASGFDEWDRAALDALYYRSDLAKQETERTDRRDIETAVETTTETSTGAELKWRCEYCRPGNSLTYLTSATFIASDRPTLYSLTFRLCGLAQLPVEF